ncbi:hypothetical protein RAS1_10640 [Phycisphaerae bacterium RAS1]|nr:hypothetical protein RAS1_10640 [Phycisphaerae bacterium RAS1]
MYFPGALALLLLPDVAAADSAWATKVAPAVVRAEKEHTTEAFLEAFDIAWRADDWGAGLKLAQAARQLRPDDRRLDGCVVRSLWRAGRLAEAEAHAARLSDESSDPVVLSALITLRLARMETGPALRAARRLEQLNPKAAGEWFFVLAAKLTANETKSLAGLVRRVQKLCDPKNGYPETIAGEEFEGFPEFLEAAGPERLNQISSHGSCDMPVIGLINLPGVDVMINGHGPYRMVLDTGGSIALSLDAEAAQEAGVKTLAKTSVRGVSGKDEAGHALVEEVRIGSITCKRVMTRVFDVRKSTAFAADGIIGTGIFLDGRMTMDFEHGKLTVSASSQESGPGTPVELRLISDAKMVTPVTVHGQPAVAILDSGADVVALSTSKLRALFPDKDPKTFSALAAGVGSEAGPEISMMPGFDLVIGGRTYRKISGLGLDVLDNVLGPFIGVQSDALVGMPVFRDMRRFTVDFARCRMWFEWMEEK